MKFLYRCLTYVYVMPLSVAICCVRLFGSREQSERLGLGLPALKTDQRPLWFVASSVGEVMIAAKLIRRLKERCGLPVLLTVTTKTGRKQALRENNHADVVAYHPLDIPTYVKRCLTKYNPVKIVLMETELWPSLMTEALGRGVEIMQVSGRLSEKSLRRYRPLKPLLGPLLQSCSGFLMQSDEDAGRLRELAGDTAAIEVIGSLKNEYVAPTRADLEKIDEYLRPWKQAEIIACGSTRPGEEEILLKAFGEITHRRPNARMVLAPRHLDRIAEVVALVKKHDLSCCLRSQAALTEQTQILVLDTIGELNPIYHHAAIAFVGGTLVPLGGHNLLEPALAGCPVLYGPHFFNQKPGQNSLAKHQIGQQVSNGQEFAEAVVAILSDQQARAKYATRAAVLRQESATIIDRYVNAILR